MPFITMLPTSSPAAFVTVGLIAGGFSAIRRTRDSLLIYFALFASLYGLRLWVQSELFKIIFTAHPLYWRIRAAINYSVPLPGFMFFAVAGFLPQKGRLLAYAYVWIEMALAVATILFGPSRLYDLINNVSVIAILLFVSTQFIISHSRRDVDFAVTGYGMLAFFAFALFDNLSGMLSWPAPRIEPIGFAFFLSALGYVAARRTLERDHQLNEIQKELEVARRIQLSILPADFPASPHFRVAARYVPMTSVAGDFYDFVITDEKQAGLLIADVSGHGVPAALIASMVKLAAASQRAHAAEPARFLAGMNAALCGNTQSQFVTAAYLHLDSTLGELRYSAAGHPPMLLARDGTIKELEENGLILAAFDFAAYTEVMRPLKNGDRALLYTDGIVEATNSAGEFFGRERLSAALAGTAKHSTSEAADHIISSVREWSAKQDDDLTVIVCDYVQ